MEIKKTNSKNKILSLLLALTMMLSLWTVNTEVVYATETSEVPAATVLAGGETITAGGTYQLAENAEGQILIQTNEQVTIVGNGVAMDEAKNITSTANSVYFDCSSVSGANLTLKDVYLSMKSISSNMINFAGQGNVLTIEGVCVLDYEVGGGTSPAQIHVASGADLTINGSGTLYQYKNSQGAGIGGNSGELNGAITFAMTGQAFFKGTKQGALIGAGSSTGNISETPGAVTFKSGEYNLVSVSRGAVIGGAAGSGGASSGTTVNVEGGSININVDYSGAAVGGGGYSSGNDATGGTLYVSGGSFRSYIDSNAANNTTTGWNGAVFTEGINDAAITAQRLNKAGEKVYWLIFDTTLLQTDAESFNVSIDDTAFYTGGLHKYSFINETLNKDEQVTVTSTPANWVENTDTNLYFYVTGKDHAVTVNGETFNYVWDAETNTFALEEKKADSLTLNADEITLKTEEGKNTCQLEAVITPEEFAGETVTWISSDTEVATVDENGKVTAAANGIVTITAQAAGCTDTCTVFVGNPVFFTSEQEIDLTVSDFEKEIQLTEYKKAESEEESSEETEADSEEGTESAEDTITGYAVALEAGNYTYTVKAEGYYSSTCAFTVAEDGKVSYTTSWTEAVRNQYGLDKMLDTATGTFNIDLEVFTPSSNAGAWDGTTLDVSWFDPAETEHYISTPAQFAGLAAIVNGIYNNEITTIIDTNGTYTPEEYAAYEGAKIVEGKNTSADTSGPNGNNKVTSSTYYFSGKGYDFDGMKIYLTADLDMGGYQDSEGNWNGARYMPIGGQYQMHYIKKGIADGFSHLGSSFNGTLDGQGHIVYNIYCDRYSVTDYGDSASVGLIGRLGIHDDDYSLWKTGGDATGNYPAVNPTVRNIAVDGYIYARRSVGGIVGKIGRTSASELDDKTLGGIIENCVNFAAISNTDSKGCGGIVGASWNCGMVRNCANFGTVSSTYNNPTGGIVGSNEISIVNCYSIGQISAKTDAFAMGIGSENELGTDVRNCYWLTGTAPGGGYYTKASNSSIDSQVVEIKNKEYMTTSEFLTDLRGTSRAWAFAGSTDAIYSRASGLPVPICFTNDTAAVTSFEKTADVTKKDYVAGERFDTTGLEVYAVWSNGDRELLDTFTLSIDRALEVTDTEITVSAVKGGKTWSETYAITVKESVLDYISVHTQPNNYKYNEGDLFDPTGLSVKITYTNGQSVIAVYQDGQFVNSDDQSLVYDITLNPAAGTALSSAEWDGKGAEITYTYKEVTSTTKTTAMTVVSGESVPEQDEEGTYLVGTAGELDWVGQQILLGTGESISVKLTQDITASENFVPYGTTTNKFTGTFDGDGHTVTLNLSTDVSNTALIGYAEDTVVKNLTVAGTVAGYQYTAGIVGYAVDTTIENCRNEASVTGTGSYAGGIVGYMKKDNESNAIKNCINTGTVQGSTCVGGIVGNAYSVTIENCGNEGNVNNGSGANIGGIAGIMNVNASAVGCYNTGAVSGSGYTGGIAGSTGSSSCSITDCYNWGTISGNGSSDSNALGGIAGKTGSSKTTVSNVYNAGTIISAQDAAYAGAVIGNNAGSASGYYWYDGCGSVYAIGSAQDESGKCTADELKESVLALGESFKANTDETIGTSCLPILSWQEACGHEAEEDVCVRCGASTAGGILGDVNNDTKINLKDAILLQRYVAGMDVGEINLVSADVNCDTKINLKDAILLQRYVAGMIDSFGN